uniref:MCM family protein n=1 Tax=Methanococcus maripaludis (strain C6 / ATCC BAA-1332) TaxID=444158 RepID=A9A752_METM6
MDDKRIADLRPKLIDYMKQTHSDDMLLEVPRLVVDIKDIQLYGIFEFLDYLEESPKEALKLLKEAYYDAYHCYKMEKTECAVGVKNLPDTLNRNSKGKRITIEDIKGVTYGKLVEIEGIVVMATKIKLALKEGVYVCTSCGSKEVVNYERPFEVQFEPICSKCAQNMSLVDQESKYIDFQELKIQQPLDLMEDPEEPPKFITVFLENTPGIYCGRVKVTGIPIKNQKNKKIPLHDLLIMGYNCELVSEKLNPVFSEEDIEKFERFSKNKDAVKILSKRISPEIKGYDTIKTAILLQQVRGVKKGRKRADSHILLITDPGTGKSKMLSEVTKIPGNVYGSITTASGVGLTASVVQERTEIGENTWVVKPGLLVKANGGTACLDELTVNRGVLSYVLEAMESQTVHISKGGINTKLPAACSVLAACNPKWGRYDDNISIMEQINIPAPLLSRFDLIFPIKDTPNRDRDSEIANHILDTHIAATKAEKDREIGLSHDIIDGITVDFEFLCKYIAYARQKVPEITKEAHGALRNYYLQMRRSSVQITARQLEAVIRLSEAHAKLKLKDFVELEDSLVAIEMMNDSLKEVAFDPESGSFDIDKIAGMSKKERSKVNIIYDIVESSCALSNWGTISKEDLLLEAQLEGIPEPEAVDLITKLKKMGDIYEPKIGLYKPMGA